MTPVAARRPATRHGPAAPLAALLAFALLLLGGAARAQDFPKFTGLVTDAANVLPPETEASLAAKLQGLQQKTGRQLVVATVPSLGGDEIQDYGYKLGRAWGVGLKGADNGAILLVAPADRKVGIEVGYGLEGQLTDAYSSVVINGTILPRFKAGDLPGGVVAGTDRLVDLLATPDDQMRAKEQAAVAAWNKQHRRSDGGSGAGLFFALVVVFFVIGLPLLRLLGGGGRRRYAGGGGGGGLGSILLWTAADMAARSAFDRHDGGGWGGGGGSSGGGGWTGGGFTGGGGGSFGGGGASGGW